MCSMLQSFHEGNKEFQSILNCAYSTQTLTPSSSLATCHNLNRCIIFFDKGVCFFAFHVLVQINWLIDWQMQKVKQDILELCLVSEAVSVL